MALNWRHSTRAGLVLAFAAFVDTAPARAEITPEARAVVDRHVAAIGGAAVALPPRSVHLHGSIQAFGLTGKMEVWNAAPERRAAALSLGPFNLKDGTDGARAWRTDPGGKLLMLDGKDLEDARASAWFERERWVEPDQGGGRVTHAGVEKDSLGTYDVLEVAPPIGRPRRLWFDRTSGLQTRIVAKNDDRMTTVRFTDWRPVDGRRMPFHSVQEVEGMAMNRLELTVETAVMNEELPASLFAPPGEGNESAVTYLKTPGIARLPFLYSARHVWLRASVNGGPPADFLYDTGASITVLDSAWAAKNRIATEGRLQGQGAGSAGTGAFAKLTTLRVADSLDGIEMKDVRVAVLDLNTHLAPFFWRDAAGVIGFDFINRFVNEIDYDARLLVLRDPKKFQHEGAGQSVPFTLSGHVPIVEFTLDGRYSGGFRIDVGSGSTVDLHGPFVARHRLDSLVTPTLPITGGGFGGTFSSRLGRMKTMSVGPYTWERPLVILSGAQGGALTSEDYAGNIGNAILERFKVTLDYERRQMWLEPSKRYHEPDRFSRSGVQFARVDGKIVIGQVIPGSPGERDGIRVGDEVARLNGKPPEEIGLDAITELMDRSPAGTKVKLELVRGGKRLKKTLRLEALI